MKKIMFGSFLAFMVVSLLGSQGLLYARKKHEKSCNKDVIKELDLSKDQLKKFKQHKAQYKKERIRLCSEQEILQIDLHSELQNDEIDRAKVDEIINKIAELHKQKLTTRVNAIEDLKKILTSTQWEKYKSSRKFKGKHHKKHKHSSDSYKDSGCDYK